MNIRPTERSVEKQFVAGLRRLGVQSLKLTLQGNAGWPDRLVLLPGGHAVFIELKRPGGKLRKLQEHTHEQLRALGFPVATYESADGALHLISGLLKAYTLKICHGCKGTIHTEGVDGFCSAICKRMRNGA